MGGCACSITRVCTEEVWVRSQDVGRLARDEKGVLHVACRMVGGEIQGREYVPVIFDFRPFGNRESEAGENVDNLAAHNVERMACAHRHGGRSARKVDCGGLVGSLLAGGLGAQGVDALCCLVFQFVEFGSEFALLFGGNSAEVVHQLRYRAFLAEIFNAEFLNLGLGGGCQGGDFRLQRFDFMKHDCQKFAANLRRFIQKSNGGCIFEV